MSRENMYPVIFLTVLLVVTVSEKFNYFLSFRCSSISVYIFYRKISHCLISFLSPGYFGGLFSYQPLAVTIFLNLLTSLTPSYMWNWNSDANLCVCHEQMSYDSFKKVMSIFVFLMAFPLQSSLEILTG
jgi:hypothetical protein